MFPHLRQRLGTAVLDRLDVLVELSTLGAYGVAEDGRPLALEGNRPVGRARDDCPLRGRPTPRRCDVPARP